ncbi:MAG TPA: hypothetical protein VG944_05420 [Fimbriimonas sp.]|nr:hypothetical protein [Fimbriimonas sp.]
MRRSNNRTETISCDDSPTTPPVAAQETAFEKQRGISRVETRVGFCQVYVGQLSQPLSVHRLAVLRAIASSGISIDFLKLTPSGLSFVVPEGLRTTLVDVLQGLGVQHSTRPDRTIIMVHAVNMRDEEGLIAEIVESAIASGAQIDHIGDGHDHLLLVLSSEHAPQIAAHFEQTLMGGVWRQKRLTKSA